MIHSISDVYESNDSTVSENFLNTFQLLSEKQKKIWQILFWYTTNFRQVFPSQATIAEKVGCCRETVIEALKKFEQMNWIYSQRRCFRSKLYFMQDCLKKFDTRKDDTFRIKPTPIPTENPTTNPTLYNTYSNLLNVRSTSDKQKSGTVQDINPEKEQLLRKIGITKPEDIFCLSRFKYHVLCKAYEDLTTRWYKAGPIQKLAAWITSRCKQYEPHYSRNPLIS